MMDLARRLDSWFYACVPRERLALLRLGIGAYAVIYLVVRASHLNAVVDYPVSSFAPLGLVQLIAEPLSKPWVYGLFAATLVTGVLFTAGAFYRVTAPAFALLLLWVMTYRHAWGMIFHTDNLLVFHVLLLALAPASDAYAYPRLRGQDSRAPEDGRHGWAVRALCLVTVASYLVAGVAKLTHTGWEWAAGGALREQVAYDAIRKIELGSVHSPFGPWLLPHEWLFTPLSAFSLATELLAPVALLGARLATVWCISAWLFHVGVLALMAIAFPYPLSGCAFLAFFPVERWLSKAAHRFSRTNVVGGPVGP
jgi:hypothetical protein